MGHSAGGLQRGRHPGLREAMAQELLKLARIADGVRCDMAMLILPEVFQRTWGERSLPTDGSPPVDALFWPETIGRVKARNPGFIFMAEVYWDLEWTIMRQGFDYCYDKSLYDRFLSRDAAAVRAHLWADMAYQNRLARFLENHDEPPGRPMIFRRRCTRPQPSSPSLLPACGSFMKVNSKAAGSRSPCIWLRPEEPVDSVLQEFYRNLLACLERPEVRDGRWQLLEVRQAWEGNPSWDRFLAFVWEGERNQRLLITVNYGPTQGQCYMSVPLG